MAIPFLNNITLNNNEIQNVRLQSGGSPPLNSGPGQIYFDSTAGDETAKYYSNANPDLWVSLKEYSFPTVAKADGYITSIVTGTTAKPIVKFNLNATGTADSTTYLRGDNQWESISAIPGTYTWSIQADQPAGTTAVASGDAIDFAGGTNVTTVLSGTTLTINSTDQFVGTVTNVEAGTGLVIESGTSTVDPEIGIRYSGVGNYILSAGSATDAAAADKINFNDADDNEVKQTTFGDIPIDALTEVKTYIDNSVAGGLIYQGGYNASTNTPDLTTSPNSILKGWTYTVTVEGTFFGEQLRVGDVLIAEQDDPSALTDWTTVQNNIDLATDLQVGIGNVNIDGAGNKDGLALAYASGTATVGLDIDSLPNLSVAIAAADLAALEIPLYNGDTSDANEKIELATLLSAASGQISYAKTITDTDTNILHGLNTSDVMVQLYDVTTGETVYADVERISATRIGVTFSATPTNDVRVLVQKIG